jgi:hypothetical protein
MNSFKRNDLGLLEGVEYKYRPNGAIDWCAMFLPEHLTLNKQYEKVLTEKHGKPFTEIKISEVEDKHLLILLAGIKYIAALRGFTEVRPNVVYVSDNKVVVSTQVLWTPNFETNGQPVSFGDVGAASHENTVGFGQRYLEAIATNRAFARAVRNFLNINIVAQDEVDSKVIEEEVKNSVINEFSPQSALKKALDKQNLGFDDIKKFSLKNCKKLEFSKEEVEAWVDLTSISAKNIFTLLESFKSKE